MTVGSAVLDFGAFPGASMASVDVTGQASIAASSKVCAALRQGEVVSFSTGAESGTFAGEGVTEVDMTGTETAIVTTTPRTGTYCYQASGPNSNSILHDSGAYYSFSGAADTTYTLRGYLRVATQNVSAQLFCSVLRFYNGSIDPQLHYPVTARLVYTANAATAKLQLWNSVSGNIGSQSAPFATDAYVSFELRLKIGVGATDEAALYLAGVLVASATGLTLSDTPPTAAFWGVGYTPPFSQNPTVRFDDIEFISVDHSQDEHQVEQMKLTAGNIVAATGFTIYGECLNGFSHGKWNVDFVWR